MNQAPYSFVHHFAGAVVAALITVVLVAALSIPFNLVGHPGELRTVAVPTSTHMT